MKTIRIFSFPSHQSKDRTSGVDFARILQPMKYLNGYKDEEVQIEVEHFDINKKTDWLEVVKRIDIIYFNYLQDPWGFAAMGAMARKHNVKMVMDLDDSLWDVKSDNSAHNVFHKGSEGIGNFTAICNEVDYITTTNRYLKNVIIHHTRKRHDQVIVLPNYVDLSLYNHISPFKDTTTIQLMHYGSTTHFADLNDEEFKKGIDKIFSEYPNVTLRMVGAFLPKYRLRWGMRYENAYGDVDIYKWIKGPFRTYMDEADILVVPLTSDTYNKCKSDIKYLEASSTKKPGIYQRIRQYEDTIEEGKDGLLASTAEEWYTNIKALIDNPTLRKNMGEAAYEKIKNEKQIQNHVRDYAQAFKLMLDRSDK